MIEARRFLPLLAAAGALVLVHLLFDLISGSAGVDLATPFGRLRLISMAWSKGPAFMIADVCLVVAALGLENGQAIGGLAKAQLAIGVVLFAAIPFFLTSAAGVSSTIGVAGEAAFQLQVTRVLLGLALVGGSALVASRALSDPRLLQGA